MINVSNFEFLNKFKYRIDVIQPNLLCPVRCAPVSALQILLANLYCNLLRCYVYFLFTRPLRLFGPFPASPGFCTRFKKKKHLIQPPNCALRALRNQPKKIVSMTGNIYSHNKWVDLRFWLRIQTHVCRYNMVWFWLAFLCNF